MRYAVLFGQPNSGKTTLFNKLDGGTLRAWAQAPRSARRCRPTAAGLEGDRRAQEELAHAALGELRNTDDAAGTWL